jgi:hypothetical protein
MSTRILRAALLTALVVPFAAERAHADIYTWIDASGVVNVSNLAPPPGVRVTNVTHQKGTQSNSAATREAEMQAMKARIRNLELEVELATRPPVPPDYRPAAVDYRPAAVDYRPVPVPVSVPYVSEPMSWPMPYVPSVAPPPANDCPWNCGLAWGSPIYPVYPSVVVVTVPSLRGGHHGHRGHRSTEPRPSPVVNGARRR